MNNRNKGCTEKEKMRVDVFFQQMQEKKTPTPYQDPTPETKEFQKVLASIPQRVLSYISYVLPFFIRGHLFETYSICSLRVKHTRTLLRGRYGL